VFVLVGKALDGSLTEKGRCLIRLEAPKHHSGNGSRARVARRRAISLA